MPPQIAYCARARGVGIKANLVPRRGDLRGRRPKIPQHDDGGCENCFGADVSPFPPAAARGLLLSARATAIENDPGWNFDI